jgi:hypothetical protein
MFETKVVGKIEIHVFPESRAVYEIMWKNMLEPDRPQMTIIVIAYRVCFPFC